MKMAKIESAMRLTLAYYEAFNRHDVPGMVQAMSDDFVFESGTPAPEGTVYQGKERVAHYWYGFFEAVPEARIDVEDAFGLGSRCVAYWRFYPYAGAAASGTIRGVDIFYERGGRLAAQISYRKGEPIAGF